MPVQEVVPAAPLPTALAPAPPPREGAVMIAEIQCLPTPAGTPQSAYAHIEAAIGSVVASGLTYEVGPLGTSLEGPADAVWATLRAAHEATLASGAGSVVTVIKVFSDAAHPGPGMSDLVAGYR